MVSSVCPKEVKQHCASDSTCGAALPSIVAHAEAAFNICPSSVGLHRAAVCPRHSHKYGGSLPPVARCMRALRSATLWCPRARLCSISLSRSESSTCKFPENSASSQHVLSSSGHRPVGVFQLVLTPMVVGDKSSTDDIALKAAFPIRASCSSGWDHPV